MRIVLDTNVLINALLSKSNQAASVTVLDHCLTGLLKPQMGSTLFAEYEDVINRTEIRKLTKRSVSEVNLFLDALYSKTEWSKIYYRWRPNLKDESDNHLIELATSSGAECIVTNNTKDLLSGDLKFAFKILTPKQLLETL